ncbi:MAG: hypothetical protein NTY35_07215 [Planctomycetota bacterium]|nr:hypothetical protein [Planctomycetota bacterium]
MVQRVVVAAVLVAGTAGLVLQLRSPIGVYDEGLLLTNSWLVAEGGMPHRDFYTNYPPGIYLAIAGIWKVFGVSVHSVRLLGLALHALLAILAGKLGGRMLGRGFSWSTASIVLVWGAGLGLTPRAWLAAMVAGLLFAWLMWKAIDEPRPVRFVLAGLALGLVGSLRHDLFGYLVLSGFVFFGLRVVVTRTLRVRALVVPGLLVALGAALVLVPVWIPVLRAAGGERVVLDLFVEQSRVLAGRELGLFARSGWRGFQWMFVLEVAAPITAGVILWRKGWSDGLAILGALSLAALPAASGRTDAVHVIGSAAPALVLFAFLGVRELERRSARGPRLATALALVGALVVPAPRFLSFRLNREAGPKLDFATYDGLPETPERAEGRADVLDFVRAHTKPGEPIFVGTRSHRVIFVNELDLYYLAQRPGATRWLQFDPNLTNRLDVQVEIASDLERTHAEVVILCSCCYRDESNGNDVPGSAWLDEYLASRYAIVRETGPYRLLQRRPEPR